MRALMLSLVLCGCGASHDADDAGVDGGPELVDVPVIVDTPDVLDALDSRCAAPVPLAAGEIVTLGGSTVACRPEPSLAFVEITLPPFSQMVPLPGASLPEVIGDCACDAPYVAATVGYGEALVLVAVGPPHEPIGYGIERLEDHAACNYAVLLAPGVTTPWARLDRGGAHVRTCATEPVRPLHYRLEAPLRLTVEVEPEAPFRVDSATDCDARGACFSGAASDGRPLDVDATPGVLMISPVGDATGVSVRVIVR